MTPDNKNPFANLKALADELNAITTQNAKLQQEALAFKENVDKLTILKAERNNLHNDMEKLYHLLSEKKNEELANELANLALKFNAINQEIEILSKKNDTFTNSTSDRLNSVRTNKVRTNEINNAINAYDEDNATNNIKRGRGDSDSSEESGMGNSDDENSENAGKKKQKIRKSKSS